jgi:hypothetical protein
MLAETLFFLIVLWAAFYDLILLNRIVLPAFKTRILQARASSYSCAKEPLRFAVGILFWFLVSAILFFVTYLMGTNLWEKVKLWQHF